MTKPESIFDKASPKPLGNYAHAVGFKDLLFLSGIASRDPVTDKVPGLELDASGRRLSYNISAETRGTLENIRRILESSNSSLESIIEINVYLTDMKDFAAYNKVFAEYFPTHRPARTTVAVAGLPGDISIEMKAIAVRQTL